VSIDVAELNGVNAEDRQHIIAMSIYSPLRTATSIYYAPYCGMKRAWKPSPILNKESTETGRLAKCHSLPKDYFVDVTATMISRATSDGNNA
jgi:hypothetical protein